MKIILLGPPGVGKGTQALKLQKATNLSLLGMSAVLADPKLPVDQQRQITHYKEQGLLVPDPLVFEALSWALEKRDNQRGYILDGFPRTIDQAKWLIAQVSQMDFVIYFSAPESVLVERISGRLIEPVSGRTYHTLYASPKTPGVDDINGRPLIRRKDDDTDVVKNRLKVYDQQTKPLVQWIKDQSIWSSHYHQINADQSPDKVWSDLNELIFSEKKI